MEQLLQSREWGDYNLSSMGGSGIGFGPIKRKEERIYRPHIWWRDAGFQNKFPYMGEE
jgi:hypothetical protein